MKTHTIDIQCQKSVAQAEKRKAKLENTGYELTHSFGDSRFVTLIFEK
jgi:hypothetical protein